MQFYLSDGHPRAPVNGHVPMTESTAGIGPHIVGRLSAGQTRAEGTY